MKVVLWLGINRIWGTLLNGPALGELSIIGIDCFNNHQLSKIYVLKKHYLSVDSFISNVSKYKNSSVIKQNDMCPPETHAESIYSIKKKLKPIILIVFCYVFRICVHWLQILYTFNMFFICFYKYFCSSFFYIDDFK